MTEGSAMNRGDSSPENIFERYPRLTILGIIVTIGLAIDLSLALLIPRVGQEQTSFRTVHSYYHHGLLPNCRVITRWGSINYVMATNSLGNRDHHPRPIPLRIPAGKRRVVIAGDSFVEGIGVPWEESFVGRLASLLEPEGVDVHNAGAVSYSPKLYYLKIKYLLEVEGFACNELYVCIDISDALDELTYKTFVPSRMATASKYLVSINKSLARFSYMWRTMTGIARHMAPLPFSGEWAEISYWFSMIDESFRSNPDFAYGRAMWTIDSRIMEKYGRPGLACGEESMRHLVDLCHRNGIRVTIVVYPWKEQIRHGEWDCLQVSFWREFSLKNGAGFIDLFPLFITGEDSEKIIANYFIAEDIHWNAEGHRRVAETLAAHVRNNLSVK